MSSRRARILSCTVRPVQTDSRVVTVAPTSRRARSFPSASEESRRVLRRSAWCRFNVVHRAPILRRSKAEVRHQRL